MLHRLAIVCGMLAAFSGCNTTKPTAAPFDSKQAAAALAQKMTSICRIEYHVINHDIDNDIVTRWGAIVIDTPEEIAVATQFAHEVEDCWIPSYPDAKSLNRSLIVARFINCNAMDETTVEFDPDGLILVRDATTICVKPRSAKSQALLEAFAEEHVKIHPELNMVHKR